MQSWKPVLWGKQISAGCLLHFCFVTVLFRLGGVQGWAGMEGKSWLFSTALDWGCRTIHSRSQKFFRGQYGFYLNQMLLEQGYECLALLFSVGFWQEYCDQIRKTQQAVRRKSIFNFDTITRADYCPEVCVIWSSPICFYLEVKSMWEHWIQLAFGEKYVLCIQTDQFLQLVFTENVWIFCNILQNICTGAANLVFASVFCVYAL